MRWITELHNRHKNKPIWIAGSDPTLNGYPDDFFDNKIGITLHLAALKFPNATYRYFNEYDRLEYLMKKDSGFLDKENIFAWPFYRRTEEECAKLTGGTDKAYYLKLRPYPPNGRVEDIFGGPGIKAMQDQVVKARNAESVEFGGYGTCAHGCLYVAIMAGGNPINLIGCNFKSFGDKEHFDKANNIDKKMRPDICLFSDPSRTKRMFAGTSAIIEGCKKIGVKVNLVKDYERSLHFDKGL